MKKSRSCEISRPYMLYRLLESTCTGHHHTAAADALNLLRKTVTTQCTTSGCGLGSLVCFVRKFHAIGMNLRYTPAEKVKCKAVTVSFLDVPITPSIARWSPSLVLYGREVSDSILRVEALCLALPFVLVTQAPFFLLLRCPQLVPRTEFSPISLV